MQWELNFDISVEMVNMEVIYGEENGKSSADTLLFVGSFGNNKE